MGKERRICASKLGLKKVMVSSRAGETCIPTSSSHTIIILLVLTDSMRVNSLGSVTSLSTEKD